MNQLGELSFMLKIIVIRGFQSFIVSKIGSDLYLRIRRFNSNCISSNNEPMDELEQSLKSVTLQRESSSSALTCNNNNNNNGIVITDLVQA